MQGAFERLGQSVLRRIGQDAFLLQGATTIPTRANIEHGVQITGSYDDATFVRDVITLPSNTLPVVGNTVTLEGVDYVLDGLVQNSGVLARFTVQKA